MYPDINTIGIIVCWILSIIVILASFNYFFISKRNDLVRKISPKPSVQKGIYTFFGISAVLYLLIKIFFHYRYVSESNFF